MRARKESRGEEVVRPCGQTQRQNSIAMKKTAFKPLNKILEAQLAKLRQVNPYLVDRDPTWANTHFWIETWERIFNEVFMSQKNKLLKQHTINIGHMRQKLDHFGEALEVCEEVDLIPLMEFNYDFDDTLVAQFIATVHFGIDD